MIVIDIDRGKTELREKEEDYYCMLIVPSFCYEEGGERERDMYQ